MNLRALVLCSDEKILKVLRRVLSDLEIDAEHCTDADTAVRKLTRQRFEAVIVDCDDQESAANVLKSVRRAPCNQHAVAVALLDGVQAVKSVFAQGAHFALYKPITTERAKNSFRAARALMKCERRRNSRVPIELPVTLVFGGTEGSVKTTTLDLSEGGMATRFARQSRKKDRFRVSFALPGNHRPIDCEGEMAWEDDAARAGIRFVDMQDEDRSHVKAWLLRHLPEMENDDPPVACKLTDLSPGGCYLEIATPFPVRTRVTLATRCGDVRVEIEGMVRVAHPEAGMGVEFVQNTGPQQQKVEKFIESLVNSKTAAPAVDVKPEGMDDGPALAAATAVAGNDPLLELFHRQRKMSAEAFLGELRRQRGANAAAARA